MAQREDAILKTTKTSLEIINLLEKLNGATVSQVAEELDMPPSTVHGHLATLEDQEFVVQKGDVYYLSLRFVTLGNSVRDREHAYSLADRYTQRVVDETGCRSIFAVEEHGRGVYLSRNAGSHSKWQHERTGERFPLHATAAGKALLAQLPPERIDEIVDKWGLPEVTENTITDRDKLHTEIETVREEGIAFNDEEQIEGIRAISTPIEAPNGRGIGALSVNGPANRLADEGEEWDLAETLRGIANEFKLDIKLADEQ